MLKLVSILDTYMHNEFSVFCHCFVDANAVKVKFLCQVDGITSLLHGVPQLWIYFGFPLSIIHCYTNFIDSFINTLYD